MESEFDKRVEQDHYCVLMTKCDRKKTVKLRVLGCKCR